jgi:hypothetical protein
MGEANERVINSFANFDIRSYQYGKYLPHIGPQTRFPIPPGILNLNGANYLSISVWAQTNAGAKLNDITLINYGQYTTGFPLAQINGTQLQPLWTSDRMQYA